MTAAATLDLFRCAPLGCSLTRVDCAARHARARKEEARQQTKGVVHIIGGRVCASCLIGEAHARGEQPTAWPDGAPLTTTTRELPAPGSSRWTSAPRSEERSDVAAGSPPPVLRRPSAPRAVELEQEEGRMKGQPKGQPKRYTWGERTLTLGEWAREPEVKALGLTDNTLRARIVENGWPVELALTTPKGAPRGHRGPLEGGSPAAAKPARALAKKLDEAFAAPVVASPRRTPRSNGGAIQERLSTVVSPEGVVTPALILETAGYRVVGKQRVPAGLLLIVEIGGAR